MFKNGGPIKEGIMSGMKEPQAINTVGSPFAPRDASGRQGYAVQFAPLLLAAGRALARPFGQFVARQSKGGKLLGLKPVEKFKPNVFGKYLMDSPEGRLLMGTTGYAGKAGQTIFKGAKSLAKSPLTVGAGLYYGGGALLPDGTPDPDDPKNQVPDNAVTGTTKPGEAGGTTVQSKADADKIAKDRIEANRKRYYELMGLDKAKKDDVYRGLIEASNIIQEEGADLKRIY